MSTIVTRAAKGSALTHNEVDANFVNLNTDKAEKTVANTFTANQIVSVTDNTNAALRITQLGTGNALLVEDSTNPDATPFVIKQDGSVGIGTLNPAVLLNVSGTGSDPVFIDRYGDNAGAVNISTRKARGTESVPTIVLSNDAIGRYQFRGYDGTQFIAAASIDSFIDGTPGTNDMPGRLTFSTTADGANGTTERMRIDNAGRVGIGGAAPAGSMIWNIKSITGATTSIAYDAVGTIQSDVTNSATGYRTNLTTQATSFTLASLRHFQAAQSTIGVGSIVTNQYGFVAESSLTGATNNYGFYGAIPSGANRYNLYMQGTAANYFAGDLTVYGGTAIPAGGTTGSGYKLSSTTNFGVFFGSGAPTLSAAKGSLYLRSDGTTTNNRMYVNTDGATTWTAVTTAA